MNHHNQSFFGQKSAVILDSAAPTDPFIYLRFLKKLSDGRWEKPSQGEGKNLKLNLLEIIEILHVLKTPSSQWSTVHKYEDQNTSIKVVHKNSENTVQFFITGYAKPLGRAETRLFTDLLEHIYQEKIKFATGGKIQKAENNTTKPQKDLSEIERSAEKKINSIDPKEWLNALKKDGEFLLLPGEVTARRELALSYAIDGKRAIWIPISQIKVDGQNNIQDQNIWVKEWYVSAKLNEIFQNA